MSHVRNNLVGIDHCGWAEPRTEHTRYQAVLLSLIIESGREYNYSGRGSTDGEIGKVR